MLLQRNFGAEVSVRVFGELVTARNQGKEQDKGAIYVQPFAFITGTQTEEKVTSTSVDIELLLVFEHYIHTAYILYIIMFSVC